MTRVKVSEEAGPVLDWMVAKAEGRLGKYVRDESRPGTSIIDIDFDEHGELAVYVPGRRRNPYEPWCPSVNWAQGGPIIEQEKIDVYWDEDWYAKHPAYRPRGRAYRRGPTPLIAACRCFVVLRLGDEVDVPEGLL